MCFSARELEMPASHRFGHVVGSLERLTQSAVRVDRKWFNGTPPLRRGVRLCSNLIRVIGSWGLSRCWPVSRSISSVSG